MRYSLIIAALLLAGIGEYVYVELAPFPPERRQAKIEQMPIVRLFVAHADRQRVKAAFARSEDGTILRANRRDTVRWESPDAFWEDFQAGKYMARFQLLDIRNEQKARRMLPEARRKALEGSTPHMHDYLLLSKQTKQPEEEARAIELLQADSTAFAAYFLAFMGPEENRVTPFTAEWMILIVRYLHEDLHHPDWPGEMFHKAAEHDSTYFARILNASESEDYESVEAVTRLRDDYNIDLYHWLANWNGGHIERDFS